MSPKPIYPHLFLIYPHPHFHLNRLSSQLTFISINFHLNQLSSQSTFISINFHLNQLSSQSTLIIVHLFNFSSPLSRLLRLLVLLACVVKGVIIGRFYTNSSCHVLNSCKNINSWHMVNAENLRNKQF